MLYIQDIHTHKQHTEGKTHLIYTSAKYTFYENISTAFSIATVHQLIARTAFPHLKKRFPGIESQIPWKSVALHGIFIFFLSCIALFPILQYALKIRTLCYLRVSGMCTCIYSQFIKMFSLLGIPRVKFLKINQKRSAFLGIQEIAFKVETLC